MLRTKGKQDWETPDWLIAYLKATYPWLTTDVACRVDNAKFPNYIAEEQDALKTPWPNGWFCNPPYGNIAPWVLKAEYERWSAANWGVMLIPALCLATNWWHKAQVCATQIVLLTPRIGFKGPKKSPNGMSMLLVYGDSDETNALTLKDVRQWIPKR